MITRKPRSAAAQATSPREAARLRARKDAERVSGWWYVESENYFIVTKQDSLEMMRLESADSPLAIARGRMSRDTLIYDSTAEVDGRMHRQRRIYTWASSDSLRVEQSQAPVGDGSWETTYSGYYLRLE